MSEMTLDEIEKIVKRRFFLSMNAPACPLCRESSQIQLQDWIHDTPAKWRCRICDHVFFFEPLAEREGNQVHEGKER